jgi:hypothetical protein
MGRRGRRSPSRPAGEPLTAFAAIGGPQMLQRQTAVGEALMALILLGGATTKWIEATVERVASE